MTSKKMSVRHSALTPTRPISSTEITKETTIDDKVMVSSTNRSYRVLNPSFKATNNSRIIDVLPHAMTAKLPNSLIYPQFKDMSPNQCIEYLGDLLGYRDYEINFVSFWILDILGQILKECQDKGVRNINLKVITTWFTYILKFISYLNPSREDFFAHINGMLLEAETHYLKTGIILNALEINRALDEFNVQAAKGLLEGCLSLEDVRGDIEELSPESPPTRTELEKTLTPSKEDQHKKSKVSQADTDSKRKSDTRRSDGESNNTENHLTFFAQQIYKVFGSKFKYEVIRHVFSSPPEFIVVTLMKKFNFPRELGPSLRTISDSIQNKEYPNPEQSGKKTSKKEKPVLKAADKFRMELQQLDFKRNLDEAKDRTRVMYIKPQEDAVSEDFFEKLFPKSKKSLMVETSSISSVRRKTISSL